jgi:CO/xanthine dehydrogenase FAD-binding subunit
MEELCKIRRSERYLEIGAMVKLSQIINLGKIVPEALRDCISHIADPQLRNLATIGGNICNPSRRLDASAPMIILDAQYELRTAQSARWISASSFPSLPGPPVLAPQEILTRVRVPLEPWTYTWYHKFNTSDSNRPGGLIILIVRIQKNVLSNIRVIYSDRIILRDKNSETMLAGKHLPLDRKDTRVFVDRWKTYMSAFQGIENSVFSGTGANFNPELVKTQILNFIESTLMYISD